MSGHIVPIKVYLQVWLVLLILLLVTIGAAYLPLGFLNTPVALAIALAKAILIVLVFMHIRWGSRLLHLTAVAGVLWLGIMLTYVLADYMTRSWIPRPTQWSDSRPGPAFEQPDSY